MKNPNKVQKFKVAGSSREDGLEAWRLGSWPWEECALRSRVSGEGFALYHIL